MKKYLMLICIVGQLVLPVATVASAKVVRVPFFSWVAAEPDILDEGETTFPGGNLHVRGYVEGLTIDSEDDHFVGYREAVVNMNLDAYGLGPVWGTYTMEVDAYDGYWEGSFTGEFTETGPVIRMKGRGYDALAGMRIEGTFKYFGTVLGTEGVIIEHPSK